MFDEMKSQFEEGPAPKPRSKKYFGMTISQLGILGGLAGSACLLFVVAGCLFLQGGLGSLAPAPPQPTGTPQPTVTPFVLPTMTLTETPTPILYEVLIPQDWTQFKTELVEIWLPKGFKKDKPVSSESGLTNELAMKGFVSEGSIYPAGVLVSYEPIAGDSLDAYIENLPNQLSNEVRIATKGKVTVNSVEAVRLLIEMKVEGVEFNDLMYVFRDGGTVWVIQYLAQINDFYTMQDTIDKSIKTFRVVR